MMNLAEFAIRQRTFVLFFIALSVVAGLYSYFDLGKLEDPSFTVKNCRCSHALPGRIGTRGRATSDRHH